MMAEIQISFEGFLIRWDVTPQGWWAIGAIALAIAVSVVFWVMSNQRRS